MTAVFFTFVMSLWDASLNDGASQIIERVGIVNGWFNFWLLDSAHALLQAPTLSFRLSDCTSVGNRHFAAQSQFIVSLVEPWEHDFPTQVAWAAYQTLIFSWVLFWIDHWLLGPLHRRNQPESWHSKTLSLTNFFSFLCSLCCYNAAVFLSFFEQHLESFRRVINRNWTTLHSFVWIFHLNLQEPPHRFHSRNLDSSTETLNHRNHFSSNDLHPLTILTVAFLDAWANQYQYGQWHFKMVSCQCILKDCKVWLCCLPHNRMPKPF